MINIIGINEMNDTKNIETCKSLINTLSSIDKVVYARIRFNIRHIIKPYVTPLKYPVVLYTTDRYAFCLNIPVGYGGKGPTAVAKLLEHLDFDFELDDILQPKRISKFDYIKGEEYILDQNFKAYKFPVESFDSFPLINKLN